MANPREPDYEIVRRNLRRFREEAEFSQAEAAEFSGVPIDNLRRYESGKTEKVPATVLAELGHIYGHRMEDFFESDPPKAKLDQRPTFALRTRPGAKVDAKVLKMLEDLIEKANRDVSKK
jgi:transcriptional regulator with XRE-family HTH domain